MPEPGHAQRAGDAQEAEWRAREGERFLVVGIGASAGGLEAFEGFLRRLPSDSGLAYVLVQHLDPEHESRLAEILSRATHLPVTIARDGERVERNHVYVIPPGTGLAIAGGCLRLVPTEVKGNRLLVDAFLLSLAEDQRENAVAVVLSGTGSDGALGVAAVRKNGGRTFAQLPSEARYGSMSAAAIATGHVERVLPVDEMPSALQAIAAERRRHPPESMQGEEEGVREALDAVARVTGHDFSRYKRSTVLRRFHRRMASTGAATVRDYAALLRSDEAETRRLAEDLTINVTSFFRDEEVFAALERVVVPELMERRGAEGVRVWVPGCSTGEEAYSIAMLLREASDRLPQPPSIQLFATDIDAAALAEARVGRYSGAVEQQVGPERLARFFTRRGDAYNVAKALRDACIFTDHDLLKSPPFSRMDLVSCRNLLIYLEPALQRRVIELLHYALRSGGYLVLGKAENIEAREQELFEVVDKAGRVFRRREVERRPPLPMPGRPLLSPGAPAGPRSGAEVKSAAERSRSIVLEEYAPPSVVVDARGEIRYFWGANLSRYLPHHAGAPATNLTHLARRELRPGLSAALHNAARHAKAVTYRDIVVVDEDRSVSLDIVVRPLPATEEDPDELFLVVLEERRAAPAGGMPLDAPSTERLQQVEEDLASTQERLQATLDEFENANEALRVSNEQLQSMNEEMHSSNEELQTSQEELQSVNEELNTLNAELTKKVDELELLYGDLQNLFQSTQIATIFLDRDFRIARFTPAATTLFRLAERDVGRPLSDFAARFDAKDVPGEVRRVLETLGPIERTVGLVEERRWFLMRMHPYRTPSNVIAGVVVSFVDVTDLKNAEAALRDAVTERERAEQALRDADHRKDEFLAVLSHELRNPLAPIRNSLHLLQLSPADTDVHTRAKQIIGRQVDHLARIVNDLLDVTRITRGKLQLERRVIDLREVAQRTGEDHRSLFAARDVSLVVEVPPAPAWVDGDETRLAQVLGNLLQNAAKHTSSGDAVRVSVETAGGSVLLRVGDTGPGIPPELVPRLFQPFAQASGPIDRRAGGLGLGLALVKGLVESHGGTVEIASGGGRKGTEVVAGFPSAAAPVTTAAAPAPAPAPRRVLVVEDNLDAAESLKLVLESEGHTVEMAHDGLRAVECARRVRPDVVLCDIGLPGMDGYTLAGVFRRDPALREVLLVALTGYALPEDLRRAAEAGFDAHLAKPTTIDAIQELIGRLRPDGRDGPRASP